MLDVEHGYRVVVRCLRADADAVTSTRRGGNDGHIVRAHEKRPVLRFEHTNMIQRDVERKRYGNAAP